MLELAFVLFYCGDQWCGFLERWVSENPHTILAHEFIFSHNAFITISLRSGLLLRWLGKHNRYLNAPSPRRISAAELICGSSRSPEPWLSSAPFPTSPRAPAKQLLTVSLAKPPSPSISTFFDCRVSWFSWRGVFYGGGKGITKSRAHFFLGFVYHSSIWLCDRPLHKLAGVGVGGGIDSK